MPSPDKTKLVACVKHRFDYWSIPQSLCDEVRARYPEMAVVHLPDYSGLADEIADADIFVGFSLNAEQFARARKLKWIHATAAGVDQLLRHDIASAGITLTNSRGVMTTPMAEHTLGLILALARRFPSASRFQAEKEWGQQQIWDETPWPMEVSGKTLLIVGYGAIGQALAVRARALQMRIAGVKRDPSQGAEHADSVHPVAELNSVLPQADFVVLAAPVTPETEGAFGREQFAAMKKSAYFINVGRGTLVDTPALIDALEQDEIGGAALDVTEQEPLPGDHPLWRAPNIFITPHLSAVSERLWERQRDLLLENLDRWFRGEPLVNVVDQKRGY